MSDDKMLKIADLLSEASDVITEYVYDQERLKDELKKNSENLKNQVLDKEIIIQSLKIEIEQQDKIIEKLKNPPPPPPPPPVTFDEIKKKKKYWWVS